MNPWCLDDLQEQMPGKYKDWFSLDTVYSIKVMQLLVVL